MNAFKLNYARAISEFAFNLDENKFQFDTDEEKSRGLTLVNAMNDYAEFLAKDSGVDIYASNADAMLNLAQMIEAQNREGREGA